MDLKSMKLGKAEMKEYAQPSIMAEAPEYPYGLRLHLDEDALKKLGKKELPSVGAVLTLEAKVMVCDVGSHESEHGLNRNLGIQITDMALAPEAKGKSAAQTLYGE